MIRYDTYKDSGVQWLGEIPGHWGCTRLKYITSKIGSGSTPTGGADVYQESGVLFLRSQNVYNYGLELDDVVHISENIHQEMKGTHVQPGDILYNITGGSIGRCCLAPETLGEANVNQHVSIVRPRNVGNKYLLYSLQSNYCQTQMWLLQTGGNREGLSASAFKRFIITLPPLSEQQSIVSFLDHKCSLIDKMLEGKTKEIELLQELKQRVIADAVTKGLNPNVKMKATNNLCLGVIPEHWKIRRYGILFKLKPVKKHHGEELLSVFLNLGVILAATSDKRTHAASEDLSKYQLVEPTDFVMNNQQAWRGSVGVSKLTGIISPAYHIFRMPLCFDPDYANYLLRSMAIVGQFEISSRGVGSIQRTLNFNWLNNSLVPVPPLPEQRAIVSYIEERTAKIDALAEKLQQEITAITEYKQRLISDVVTGQIKVC